MMAEPVGGAKRVTIVLRSGNVHGGVYLKVLEALRQHGASGATAFQGIAGFVGGHPIHSRRFAVDYIPDLPVIIVWIDRAEIVADVLPHVLALITDGVVSVDDTSVVHSVSTEVSDLPSRELVRDVMSRDVISARPGTPIAEIVHDLLEERFRAVPVVDDARRVVGIITNSDLVERGGLSMRLELLKAVDERERRRVLEEVAGIGATASSVMTADPVTVLDTATLREAAVVMLNRRLKRLPVVSPTVATTRAVQHMSLRQRRSAA
jgi:CBS domain-containing protein